jgi:hypothetical protein
MPKPRKCRCGCGQPIPDGNTLRIAATLDCALKMATATREKRERKELREARSKTRADKLRIKKRSEWIADAQIAFNQYIRARDYLDGCICCGKAADDEAWKPGGSWDAGHYLSVGSHPELRFDEDNCHKQAKSCNAGAGKYARKTHTVNQAYRERLILKIGIKRVERLEGPHPARKYTIPELQALIAEYRGKKRELERGRA